MTISTGLTGGSCGQGYTYNVNVFACIESDKTLRVYWETPDDSFNEKLTVANWDGSAKTTSFSDGSAWCQGSSPTSTVNITATSLGTDPSGSTIVQIDWSIEATGCYDCDRSLSGSYEIILTKGEGCTLPSS